MQRQASSRIFPLAMITTYIHVPVMGVLSPVMSVLLPVQLHGATHGLAKEFLITTRIIMNAGTIYQSGGNLKSLTIYNFSFCFSAHIHKNLHKKAVFSRFLKPLKEGRRFFQIKWQKWPLLEFFSKIKAHYSVLLEKKPSQVSNLQFFSSNFQT